MSVRIRRAVIAGLGVLGMLDSLYMLSYSEGIIEHLFCPFFGPGCDIVGKSSHAKHFGVPNSAVGAVGYAAMSTLALWAGAHPVRARRWQLLGLSAIATGAAAASAYLTYEQKAKVRAWCFWCLSSAAINAAILPLALVDGVRAAKKSSARLKPS